MGFFSKCAVDSCAPPSPGLSLGTIVSLAPFFATFVAVFAVVNRKIFPRLSRVQNSRDGEGHYLPASAPPLLRQVHAEHGSRSMRRRAAAVTFATTIGLAAVLGELILAEISDLVDSQARDVALQVTVPALLFLLVLLIPFLELQSVIVGAGWSFQRTAKGRIPRVAWTLQLLAFSGWLFVFWSLGSLVPGPVENYMYSKGSRDGFDSTGMAMAYRWATSPDNVLSLRSIKASGTHGLSRACLERIGVIGISLMALLSGFASVSSPWQTFANQRARRRRPVTATDVNRKQTGVEAASDLLLSKRHQLMALQIAEQQAAAAAAAGTSSSGSSSAGLLGKLVGTIKHIGGGGSTEAAEIKSLEMEIAGLETMQANLASTLVELRQRQAADARASTRMGRLLALPNYVFGAYCAYRILAATLMMLHRLYAPKAVFASSDPINRFLGLLARHWDPKLDQVAWARQMSFLLSGVILVASAGSVLQTLRLFAKWTPGLVYQAQANLALGVGQITATYVISSAMLLRNNLPEEMSSAVGDALESALEPAFVDRWFEGWFLVASAATAAGIWVGRKLQAGDSFDDWDDQFGLEELGQKRC
ncbi:hypothetical protein CMQ_2343 [Grosmannia clavigera kw1407]|uniref:G protein-coupled receptor n=1 Tax=Grosmannia clavigera (strain kw1407 / UAMH 11150) TaxID=655863 RepID=F0XIZ4_GROCL|nr:uncharacterized protein CMQ_2343 [Grosmannia clavigera kw1407]EFX02294.1 hypothetical protein CMQ_2343 [Grosmannia clavigera kw1407]